MACDSTLLDWIAPGSCLPWNETRLPHLAVNQPPFLPASIRSERTRALQTINCSSFCQTDHLSQQWATFCSAIHDQKGIVIQLAVTSGPRAFHDADLVAELTDLQGLKKRCRLRLPCQQINLGRGARKGKWEYSLFMCLFDDRQIGNWKVMDVSNRVVCLLLTICCCCLQIIEDFDQHVHVQNISAWLRHVLTQLHHLAFTWIV